jgi:hypothetical protein
VNVSAPFNAVHSEHLSPECCEEMGYKVAEALLVPKSKVKVNKGDIGDPIHFDHVKHVSENPLKIVPTDCNETF